MANYRISESGPSSKISYWLKPPASFCEPKNRTRGLKCNKLLAKPTPPLALQSNKLLKRLLLIYKFSTESDEPRGFTRVVLFCILSLGRHAEKWCCRPKLQASGAKKDFSAQIHRQDVGSLITDNHTFERSLIC